MRGSLGGMGGNLDTGARLLVLRVMLGGEGADSRVERELEVGPSSLWAGEVVLVPGGTDGVPRSGELGGVRTVTPKSGDAAFSLV